MKKLVGNIQKFGIRFNRRIRIISYVYGTVTITSHINDIIPFEDPCPSRDGGKFVVDVVSLKLHATLVVTVRNVYRNTNHLIMRISVSVVSDVWNIAFISRSE
jgi:hypothetical protein